MKFIFLCSKLFMGPTYDLLKFLGTIDLIRRLYTIFRLKSPFCRSKLWPVKFSTPVEWICTNWNPKIKICEVFDDLIVRVVKILTARRNKLLKLKMRQTWWRRKEDSEAFSFVGHGLPTLLCGRRYDHLKFTLVEYYVKT